MAQSARLGQALEAAEAVVTQAAGVYAAARQVYEAEIEATKKRERLATTMATAWRQLLDEREEGERDELAQVVHAIAQISAATG